MSRTCRRGVDAALLFEFQDKIILFVFVLKKTKTGGAEIPVSYSGQGAHVLSESC